MKAKIYLAQTDTTVGFLSKDLEALNKIKKRPLSTPCIKAVVSLHELKKHARVPKKYKNIVRKAKKTSFIYPNKEGIRVIHEQNHKSFLSKHNWLYSTSANLTGRDFDEDYAKSVVDEAYEPKSGFSENCPSIMLKLTKEKMKKVR